MTAARDKPTTPVVTPGTTPRDDALTTPERHNQEVVACGLCGKDVSLGCRAKEHVAGGGGGGTAHESPVWRRRQDSNSSSR